MERLDSLVVKTSPRSWEGLGSNPGPAIILEFNNSDHESSVSEAEDTDDDGDSSINAK